MPKIQNLTYTGDALKNIEGGKINLPNGKELDVYIPSMELIESVNLSLYLKKPLLIMGDPGSGKTRLAESVAFELHKNSLLDNTISWNDIFYVWNIKSSSKAKDGLYTYDSLKRFQDSQISKADIHNHSRYIKKGPMGKAIEKCQLLEKNPTSNGKQEIQIIPPILLIDEIDKASIDFPNDLLFEIENNCFEIDEIDEVDKRWIGAKDVKPIIIITSNNEKKLPPAFLRRCLFYRIEFPREEELKDIIRRRFVNVNTELVSNVVSEFIDLRKKETDNEKKVSTGELLDWYNIIQHYSNRKNSSNLSEAEKSLINKLDMIGNKTGDLPPFYQVVLKNWELILNFKD